MRSSIAFLIVLGALLVGACSEPASPPIPILPSPTSSPTATSEAQEQPTQVAASTPIAEPVALVPGFTEVAVWGDGGDDVSFSSPNAIAIDSLDNVYVTEFGGDRVQKFNSDGELLTQWGGSGSEPGQFRRPTGIAIDRFDQVYVAESGNSRVQKFSSDGEWLATFGANGRGQGEFLSAMVVIVDAQDRVYVSDWGNHRVQVLDSDGAYLRTLGFPEDSAA